MLEGLHRTLIEPGSQAPILGCPGETHDGVQVERINLDGSGSEHEIAILFRDLGRPDCLFGYKIEAVETPDVPSEATSHHTDLSSAAQMWAENVWALFEEEVFASGCGLPRNCSREAITWIGGRAPARYDQGA